MSKQQQLEAARQRVRDLEKEIIEALEEQDALETGPKIINRHDQKAVNENLEGIRRGTVVLGEPERKRRVPQANEILADDQVAINSHLKEIAKGTMIIVPAYE